MVVFWILAAAMTTVALAFVLVPLLRARSTVGPTETEANLEVLRSQRREIDADVAAGTLPADAREEALEELVGRAADDLAAPPPPPVVSPRRAWAPAIAAGIAVPVLAFGLYAVIGNPLAADPQVLAAASGAGMDEKQIVAMVERLAVKVRDRPDDAQGWALLARSMAALERFREAAEAYAHVVKLVPADADVLADYADVLGMAQGRNLSGKPTELARQALEIAPNHQKALALLATAALDAGDFATSLRYWEKLATLVPPDSPDAGEIPQIIADIRQRAAAATRVAPGPRMFEKSVAQPAAAQRVTGTVSLSPELNARLSGTETVFVLARAEGGPRTPLAVMRAPAARLPLQFSLDDSQAMAAGLNISSARALRVEARISRSGEAAPRPGDMAGMSEVVAPGAANVVVLIDKVLP